MQGQIHDVAAKGFQIAPDAYERGRPEYPQDAVQCLVEKLEIVPRSIVIDLGAGTGKFTKLLVPTQAKVMAVEPVEGMRKKLASLLPEVQVVDGSAESIPIKGGTADAVIARTGFSLV